MYRRAVFCFSISRGPSKDAKDRAFVPLSSNYQSPRPQTALCARRLCVVAL